MKSPCYTVGFCHQSGRLEAEFCSGKSIHQEPENTKLWPPKETNVPGRKVRSTGFAHNLDHMEDIRIVKTLVG